MPTFPEPTTGRRAGSSATASACSFTGESTPPPDCRYRRSGDRLYLHLFAWPYRHVHLADLAGRVEYAQLLNDGSEIKTVVVDPEKQVHTSVMKGIPGALTLELPVLKPDVVVPVVELFLRK